MATKTKKDTVSVTESKKQDKKKPVRGWYVLRAISGKEAQVKEIIEGAMKNSDLGNFVFQVLIPTEKVMTLKNGKKSIKDRSLYSGYVFIEAIPTGEVIYELTNTTNVIDFLRGREKGSDPERLREEEVMRMLGAADELNEPDAVPDFMIGEQVKVADGPFKGFQAVVEEVNTDKRKVRVMVKIFGRKTPLDLEYSEVERE